MQALAAAAAIVAAYLVGSLSFAVIVSRSMGLADPRSYGSKNPGATNVLRSGNKAAALLTLAFDALKGFVPVWLALAFGPRFGLGEWTVAFVGLAAFLGHLWPVFFRFQGGKGVATAAGVLIALAPGLGLATLASWVIIAAFFRYSSLAALAEFTPDELKIDRVFVTDLPNRSRSQAIIETIDKLGAALGINIVAEGVETKDELDYLAANTGIGVAQGYFLGKPLLFAK